MDHNRLCPGKLSVSPIAETNQKSTRLTDTGHRIQPAKHPPSHSRAMPKPMTDLMVCSVCGCKLNPVNLNRHLLNVHPNLLNEPLSQLTAALLSKKLIDQNFNTIIYSQSKDDGNSRDGSKYVGHFALESGRYGSMPMHDNYDDESNSN